MLGVILRELWSAWQTRLQTSLFTLNADDMDILDVSDEDLAPLQAFVDEIKDDLFGDGDMECDVA